MSLFPSFLRCFPPNIVDIFMSTHLFFESGLGASKQVVNLQLKYPGLRLQPETSEGTTASYIYIKLSCSE